MTTVALLLAVVALVLVTLVFGAVVEVYRHVDQLRQHAGLVDRVSEVEFNEDVRLSGLDLPLTDVLRADERFAIIVLSDSCTTCAAVAQAIPGNRTGALLVLVEASSEERARTWLARAHMELGVRVVYDEAGEVAKSLGVSVTPAVVRFIGDIPEGASTVPSARRVRETLDWLNDYSRP